MKFLHGLFALLLYVVLLAGGGYIVYVAMWGPSAWKELLELLGPERIAAAGAGSAIVLLLILYMLTMVKRRDKSQYLSFKSDGGAISISTSAVREFVRRVSDEFAAVLSLQPVIKSKGSSVEIELDVRVRGGTQIPELCRMLQERVRESLRENIGVTEVRAIKVNVREIATSCAPEKKNGDGPAA